MTRADVLVPNGLGGAAIRPRWNRSMRACGTWGPDYAYEVDDFVESGGQLYRCLVGNTNVTPAGNPTEWVSLLGGLDYATFVGLFIPQQATFPAVAGPAVLLRLSGHATFPDDLYFNNGTAWVQSGQGI